MDKTKKEKIITITLLMMGFILTTFFLSMIMIHYLNNDLHQMQDRWKQLSDAGYVFMGNGWLPTR